MMSYFNTIEYHPNGILVWDPLKMILSLLLTVILKDIRLAKTTIGRWGWSTVITRGKQKFSKNQFLASCCGVVDRFVRLHAH
jgi:hypothetical protein